MFTWNFEYISKARLGDTFSQLKLNAQMGDILIRIHTGIHLEDEAVELARFIKDMVPQAQIFGTSASAVISWGKLLQSQCVVSVTQMAGARVRCEMLPTCDERTGVPLPPDRLCENVKEAVISADTKLLLTFLTGQYHDVYKFVDRCNDHFPGVQMIGGIANASDINMTRSHTSGFVFNENGYSHSGVILAAIGGEEVDCMCSYATGVQVIGEDIDITDSFGNCILSLDGENAADVYQQGIGEELSVQPELTMLFPFVYSDAADIPIYVNYTDDLSINDLFPEDSPEYREDYDKHPGIERYERRAMITANHNVTAGKKFKRAFIYDGRIIADNRALFRRVENFEKAETIFGYSCVVRSMIYSNCVKWELSAYENSNICGCLTEGEIAYVNGRNTFANCSFVVSVIGEARHTQECNPYAFSHTDTLAADNRELLSYLVNIERRMEQSSLFATAESLKAFIQSCELKLFYSESEDIPNSTAMYMDIPLKGFDRICIIDVLNTSDMKIVFTDQLIQLTYRKYVSKCYSFAKKKLYRMYTLDGWRIAIMTTSYLTALSRFAKDMEVLQEELFRGAEEYIAIVPLVCVIDDFSADTLASSYSNARAAMLQKNTQFYVHDAHSNRIDEDDIRNKYRMVNVINYAIANDGVIPFFQGIYDNKQGRIHHYEALMRLKDESGKLYNPDSFLDVARSYGLLYDSISKQMIRKVFKVFRDDAENSVSINLGMRDIKNRSITSYIYDFLSTAPHPENFVFEILENEDIDDYDYLFAFVNHIHSLGGRISIDDFGSGYSNLYHIASIQSDYIKIDGSIIKKCCDEKASENLVALISGWKQLSSHSIQIIAEYVDNEAVQEMLMEYDIDYSQGYLFSRPTSDIRGITV